MIPQQWIAITKGRKAGHTASEGGKGGPGEPKGLPGSAHDLVLSEHGVVVYFMCQHGFGMPDMWLNISSERVCMFPEEISMKIGG